LDFTGTCSKQEGLSSTGLVIRALAWRQEPKGIVPEKRSGGVPAPGRPAERKAAAEPPKAEKDYEALVEEELRKFKEKKGRGLS